MDYPSLDKGELYQEVLSLRKKIAELDDLLFHYKQSLHTTLNSIYEAVIVTDVNGSIVRMNNVAENLTGWKFEQARGKPLEKVFSPINNTNGLKAEIPVIEVLKSGRFVGHENHKKIISQDGSEFRIIDSGVPIKDRHGAVTGSLLIFREIITEELTPRKIRKNEINEVELQFRSIVEGAPDPIFIQTDSKFAYLNPAACRLFGISDPGELIGTPVEERFHQDYHAAVRERIRRLNDYRIPVQEQIEYRVVKSNGNVIWIESTGVPIIYQGKPGGLNFVRDITWRKETEKSLEYSEQRIQFALRAGNIGIWDMDLIDQSAYRSPTHDKIFGYGEMQPRWTYKMFLRHVHPEDREYVNAQYETSLSTGQDWNFECRIFRKDGQLRWIWASGRSFSDDSGELLRMIGIVMDVTSRKESESVLESNYTLLKMAGEIAQFGGWSIDLSDKDSDPLTRIVNWSDAVADIHELPRGEFITVKEAILYYAPEYREKISEVFKECVEKGTPFNEEMEFITNTGKRIWIRTLGRAVMEKRRVVKVHGALQDISKIKQAELKIKESEIKFRNLFQNHSAIKLIIDPESGRIIEANKAASEFYGWKVEEMKQMNISQINTLSEKVLKQAIQKVQNYENTHFFFKHRIANGEIKDVEIFSSKIIVNDQVFLHSIIHDITEKRKTEEQLKLLSRTVEQSPVSIEITDIKGNIEYVNPVFELNTGYKLSEIKGKNPRILKSGYHTVEFYNNLWHTILAGKEWSGEFRNKKKNGELYWEDTVISPIINESGEIINFVAVKEDITERKKMVEDLVAAKEKAEESDRLKSAFLANMSHEIRTPMSGILGFTGLLKEPGLSGQTQQKYLDIIQTSGNRMLDTVNDLIDISKIETGQVNLNMADIDLREQVENIFMFFMPQAENKNIKFTLSYSVPSEYNIIRTDRNKFNSILTNLIKNAVRFTEKGKIEIGCDKKQNSLEFYVRDTGVGVPGDKLVKIFNRFEHADIENAKIYQGSGLGLAISKAYVEMLGGKIWLESKEGIGSVFYFSIPLNYPGREISK
jgi:PAS domain S-box-containing protein